MEIRRYIEVLRRWWWLILLGTILAALATFVVSKIQRPVYEAKTILQVDQGSHPANSNYTDILAGQILTNTYATTLTSRQVLDECIKRLGLDMSSDDLVKLISVATIQNTQLITLSIENTNPKLAAVIANTIVEVFREQNETLQSSRYITAMNNLVAEMNKLGSSIQATETEIAAFGTPTTSQDSLDLQTLQNELAQYQQSYANMLQSYETLRISKTQSISNLIQVEPASVPVKSIRPRTLLNTVLGAVVGLLLVIGAIFFIEYMDDTIKTPEEAVAKLNVPVIGLIARIKYQKEDVPFVFENPRSPVTEAFRALRTNIQFASVVKPIRTILVTSPAPQEGKTLVAANLAVVMAQGGKRVILVDFDLRRPRVHKVMGEPNILGLSDLFMRDPLTLDGVMRTWHEMSLSIITSGGLPPNPAELLTTVKLKEILEVLKEQADVIILDTPPITAVTDPVIIAALSDAVILAVKPKQTRLGIAQHALEQMKRANARVIGLVFNDVNLEGSSYYYSEFYYHYGYHYDESTTENNNHLKKNGTS